MAGTNDFKAFATDANANVTSQEEWETLTALKKGFSSGKASSAQVSKALRQPSTMAAVLGQFIANAELDALDDGDVDGLVAKLATAITTNLGLGEAAKLPAISGSLSSSGWIKIPVIEGKSFIIQWGRIGPSDSKTGVAIGSYPIAFPNSAFMAFIAEKTAVSTGPIGINSWGVSELTKTELKAICAARTISTSAATETGDFLVLGY